MSPRRLRWSLFSGIACLGAGALWSQPASQPIRKSYISIYHLATQSASVLYTADKLVEAPNWSPDGKQLLVNTGGDLYTLATDERAKAGLQKIDLGGVSHCNNDKGYSPDGKTLAFSARGDAPGSQVFTSDGAGKKPTLIARESPTYFHGFSPDGKWMALVSQREKNFDLFRVPTQGGQQERLTTNAGYDDGPDYSPDGKWIYFNSDRSGSWDIWRMPAEGAGPNDAKAERVTHDEMEDWFPHCSPDGKWLLFISFPKGTAGHNDHLEVTLRMMPLPRTRLASATPKTLLTFFGGQGTINVNSWSPDSQMFAFVRFEQ